MRDNGSDRQQEAVYRQLRNMNADDVPTMRDNPKFFCELQAGVDVCVILCGIMREDRMTCRDLEMPVIVTGSAEFIDNVRLGDQDKMPESIHVNNKAYNRLFMLPLILGIAGLFVQYKKKRSDLLY